MPRTAITLIKAHTGKWSLLAGPDIPLQEQTAEFRKMRGLQSHEKLAEYRFQESDGGAFALKFRTPEEQKVHDQRRADELAKAQEAGKLVTLQQDAQAASKKAGDEAHKKYIEAHDKKALADPTRTGRPFTIVETVVAPQSPDEPAQPAPATIEQTNKAPEESGQSEPEPKPAQKPAKAPEKPKPAKPSTTSNAMNQILKNATSTVEKAVAIIGLTTGLAFGAKAGVQNSPLNGGTNNVIFATTNTYTGVSFGVGNSSMLALGFKFKCDGTNTSAITFTLDDTIGDGFWKTNTQRIAVTANGTNVVTLTTNISRNLGGNLGGIFQVRISTSENPNPVAGSVTNLIVDGFVKPGI